MDREKQPEKQAEQEERSARETKDSGNPQAGQHLGGV